MVAAAALFKEVGEGLVGSADAAGHGLRPRCAGDAEFRGGQDAITGEPVDAVDASWGGRDRFRHAAAPTGGPAVAFRVWTEDAVIRQLDPFHAEPACPGSDPTIALEGDTEPRLLMAPDPGDGPLSVEAFEDVR